MKILLVLTDLYSSWGGAQSVYRKIIESTPGCDFTYFLDKESPATPRPKNCRAVSLLREVKLRIFHPPPFPQHEADALASANAFARSVAGQHFDLADIPDFFDFGALLPSAFSHHGVKVGGTVLALHGNISMSLELAWGSAGNHTLAGQRREERQFACADGVYGISPAYIQSWVKRIPREVAFVDPRHFCLSEPSPASPPAPVDSAPQPSLYCLGRMERRKGNDLFVELVSWLRKGSFAEAWHVGSEDRNSHSLLQEMCQMRGQPFFPKGALAPEGLRALFAGRSVVVIPARYDSLNLVALDALFSGCPTAVSTRAGVSEFIDQNLHGLPYLKIDFRNFYSVVEKLQDLLDRYDHHRQALREYLRRHPPRLTANLTMQDLYQSWARPARPAGGAAYPALRYQEKRKRKKTRKQGLLITASQRWKMLRRKVRAPWARMGSLPWWILGKTLLPDNRNLTGAIRNADSVRAHLSTIAGFGERSLDQIREKLAFVQEVYGHPLGRCNLFLEMARLQRALGNPLGAATYELRLLRLLGQDRFGILPRVEQTLQESGFPWEARAAHAAYADPARQETSVHAFLTEMRRLHKIRKDKSWADLWDRRSPGIPRVAVITSLYRAAGKLEFFLTALRQQGLVRAGQVEIILVDSGSPEQEKAVVQQFLLGHPLNLVYARSAERETIQAAWNRGIGLARAPYLVFLGVDEVLYPEALECLATELDQSPGVDWVMGDSLVTAVEESGVLKHDIMKYDRSGAGKDHAYLETCYLSWVGGMYRKSIHERFGYYDETFGAAGDTEFKNRILPHLNVKFIPRLLGNLLNYPEGNTTASPRAEIEDLRAWYIHRTVGGIKYAFESRPIGEAEKLLALSLGYRKSYCRHLSSDLDYAAALAEYLGARSSLAQSLEMSLASLRAALRDLDFLPDMPRRWEAGLTLARTGHLFKKTESRHKRLLAGRATPCYKVLNDNRYEQHSWLW